MAEFPLHSGMQKSMRSTETSFIIAQFLKTMYVFMVRSRATVLVALSL